MNNTAFERDALALRGIALQGVKVLTFAAFVLGSIAFIARKLRS